MTYVPNLDPSDTYLNYQRPLGYIDITAAAVAAGLDEIELLERLLAKNFKVYLDFEPYRGQEALRDHILKKIKDGGFDGEIGTMRGTLSYKGLKSRSTIKNGVHPLTQAGLKLLIHRVKADKEGEDLFAGLSLLTPEAAEIANEVGDNGGQIHVLLEAPLFIGHNSFYPHVLIRIQDFDEAMSNPDPDCSDSVEKAWSSKNASEIFAPHSFPFKFFSRGSYIDSDKEQRLGVLCKDFGVQLEDVRKKSKEKYKKIYKLETSWPLGHLLGAFRAMEDQGWVKGVQKHYISGHFTNILLKEHVPEDIPKLNWVESKTLFHAVMKKLEIKLSEVHLHFFLGDKDMSPIRSGFKNTELIHLDRAEELLKKFRP